MKIKIEVFGPLVKEGKRVIELDIKSNHITVSMLKKMLKEKLNLTKEDINSIAIVKNDEVIVNEKEPITAKDKICLLPPVSGG